MRRYFVRKPTAAGTLAKTPTRSNAVRSMLFLVKKNCCFSPLSYGNVIVPRRNVITATMPFRPTNRYVICRLRARSRTRQFRANDFFPKSMQCRSRRRVLFAPFLVVSLAIPSALLVLGSLRCHYLFPVSFQSVYLETSTLIFFSSISVHRKTRTR